MQTPIIRYNLKDRGRSHTGQRRNFNIKAICDAINSPACQETVSARGMIGFYGHLPRVRYSLDHWDMRTGRNAATMGKAKLLSLDHWDMRTGRN